MAVLLNLRLGADQHRLIAIVAVPVRLCLLGAAELLGIAAVLMLMVVLTLQGQGIAILRVSMAVALFKAADYAVPVAVLVVGMFLDFRQGADQLSVLVIAVFVMAVHHVIRLSANQPMVGIIAFAAVLMDVQGTV
jgi:hypothetical protein